MAKKEFEVILTEPVVSLNANEGDQVKVAPGYARNFLLPQGKAVPASIANQRYLESLKARRAEREAAELEHMKDLYESLKSLRLHILVKTGENGKMFGSVTSGTICDELRNQFDVELEKKRVNLPKAIKAVGEYDVKLNLHAEIEAELKVFVESENPIEVAEEEPLKRRRNKSAVEIISGEAFLGLVFLCGVLACEWLVNKGLSVASNSALLPEGDGC